MKFRDYITETKTNTLSIGQKWLQNKSNSNNASQLQNKSFSKSKDVIEIIGFLGKNSVDVKSTLQNKIFSLDKDYILKNFTKM